MRIQEYITKEDHQISYGSYDKKLLPMGSFVKPIYEYYLPRHIKESDDFKQLNRDTQVYVYCRFGIVIIPKSIIREIA